MKDLTKIRKELHRIAELSGFEIETARTLKTYLETTEPDKIITEIGGHGIAAVYNGASADKTVMLRADMDALPISEINDFDYISMTPGTGHKCGHDGHMTILLGLSRILKDIIKDKPFRTVLLFQPAEEIAAGAKKVIEDEKFREIEPDLIFGLHNLPDFPEGSIIIKKNVFASASSGLKVKLTGRTSHAGHPENGNNPVLAMTSLIHGLMALPSMHTQLENAANITIIHARLGEIAFGTSPGEAEVMATFRSHHNSDMEIMTREALKLINGIATAHGLKHSYEWVEVFPATAGYADCVDIIEKAAAGKKVISPEIAFPWSEDFGYYLQKYKGAFFGLGSGENHPQLHNPDYDFPDAIIVPGIEIFSSILENIHF